MVAQVRCDEHGAVLLTPEVQPSTAGVRLTVENVSSVRLSIDFGTLGTESLPVGRSNFLLPLKPGTVSLACHLPGQTGASVELAVSDIAHVWIPAELDCEIYQGVVSTGEEPGFGDPVSLARSRLNGLRDGDLVETAGYPDASIRFVRVVRDGSVVAVLRYEQSDDGSWSLLGIDACQSSGLL